MGGAEPAEPGPLPCGTPHEMGVAVGRWLRHWGFDDIHVSSDDPGGVVGVRARGLVARVSAAADATGPEAVRALAKAAASVGARAACFSSAGFAREASALADQLDVATFSVAQDGRPAPLNNAEVRLQAAKQFPLEAGGGVIVRIDAEPYARHWKRHDPVRTVIVPLLAASAPGHVVVCGDRHEAIVAQATASQSDWWKATRLQPGTRPSAWSWEAHNFYSDAVLNVRGSDLLLGVWPVTQGVDQALVELFDAWDRVASTPRPQTGSVRPATIGWSVEPGAPRPDPPFEPTSGAAYTRGADLPYARPFGEQGRWELRWTVQTRRTELVDTTTSTVVWTREPAGELCREVLLEVDGPTITARWVADLQVAWVATSEPGFVLGVLQNDDRALLVYPGGDTPTSDVRWLPVNLDRRRDAEPVPLRVARLDELTGALRWAVVVEGQACSSVGLDRWKNEVRIRTPFRTIVLDWDTGNEIELQGR